MVFSNQNRQINESMDSLGYDFYTLGFHNFQEMEENPLLLLAEVAISPPGCFGYSVQVCSLCHSGYSDRQTDQGVPCYPLTGFSIAHLSSDISESTLVDPLNKETQRQVLTEPVQFKATGSSDSGSAVPLSRKGVHSLRTGKASQGRYSVSIKRKDARARAQARYAASAKGKKAKARYMASDKGRKAKARYLASDKCKETTARYSRTEKAKTGVAIRTARSNAYRSAINRGLGEQVAREKAELAADKKRAQLLSVSTTLSPQLTDL